MTSRDELELGLLSLITVGNQKGIEIASRLSANMFYNPKHGKIFKAIESLVNDGAVPDLPTLTHLMHESGDLEEVGAKYVAECCLPQYAPSPNNAERFIEELYDYHQKDRLEKFAIETMADIKKSEKDVKTLLEEKSEEFLDIGIDPRKMRILKLSDIGEKVLDLAHKASEAGGMIGIPTGFPALDNNLLGLQPGYLILIAARPSVGKTSLALNMAEHISMIQGRPSMFISLEMSAVSLYHRLVGSGSDLSSRKVRIGRLDTHEWEALSHTIGKICKRPLYIVDTPGATIPQIITMARQGLIQYKIEALFIDYLQLIQTSGGFNSRNEEVSFISKSLKNLARELNIPVVAVSQLSRLSDEKVPQLSHLRDSGSLDQDADQVLFIHRWKEDGSMKHKIIIAKARNEEIGTIPVVFVPEKTRFREPDNRHDDCIPVYA